MLNFNGAMIGSESPAKLREFYVKVFGDPVWEEQGFSGWQVGVGWFMIGAHSEVHGKAQDAARIILFMETTEVEQEFARIKEAGGEVVAEPNHPGAAEEMMIATLADPDGNYLQLGTPMGDPSKA